MNTEQSTAPAGEPNLTTREQLAVDGRLIAADGTVLATGSPVEFELFARQRLNEHGSRVPRVVRDALVDGATDVHERAGTLTPAVAEEISRLRNGAPVLNVSHQPNTLVAHGVGAQAHLLSRMANSYSVEQRPVCVAVAIDYDAAGDVRYRSPTFLGVGAHPSIDLSGAVSKKDHETVSFAVVPPEASVVDRWLETADMVVRTWCRRWPPSTSVPRTASEAKGLFEHVRVSYTNATSLSLGNVAAASRLRNLHSGDPTLFVEATALLRSVGSTVNASIEGLSEELASVEAGLAAHVWRICTGCNARVACRDSGHGTVIWACKRCSVSGVEELDFTREVAVHGRQFPAFVPRIGLCNALDLSVYRFDGTVSYAGGAEHYVDSLSRHLSLYEDIPPFLLWEPTALLVTPGSAFEEQFTDVLGAERVDLLQRGRIAEFLTFALAGSSDAHTVPPSLTFYPGSEDGR